MAAPARLPPRAFDMSELQAALEGATVGDPALIEDRYELAIDGLIDVALYDPVTGSFSANGTSAPFTPAPNKDVWVTLQGTWQASIIVDRSIDGATWLPLTSSGAGIANFSSNIQQVVARETDPGAAQYRLRCQDYVSGTVGYRLGNS